MSKIIKAAAIASILYATALINVNAKDGIIKSQDTPGITHVQDFKTQSVPENGSTALLLGAAVAGLVFQGRKSLKRA
jgi:hypothetical protein